MTNGNHKNDFSLFIVTVSRKIAAMTKPDDEFPETIIDGTTDFGLCFQQPNGFDDGGFCARGGSRILHDQKITQAAQIGLSMPGEPYLWHSGASNSFFVPQLSTHAMTSSPVA